MKHQCDMKISLIVVTKDRPDYLRNLLKSLVGQTLIPDEIVVVDNNSSRSYDSVFEEFKPLLPLVTIFEDTPGIPNARNRGIAESSGDIILFTDDDCIADEEWVQEIVKPFQKNPHIGIVGGEIFSEEKAGSIVEEFCVSETLMRIGRKEDEA
jgi:glycosyltransferase involved in cell wall biosynthesis